MPRFWLLVVPEEGSRPTSTYSSEAEHWYLVLAKFFRQSHHKIPQFGKKCCYFSGFSLLCNKISFWELKEVLFALFPI
jgi:hypothetical protein